MISEQKVSNSSERLRYLMDLRGLKQVDIIKKCEPYCKKYNIKLSKAALSNYITGCSSPDQYKLIILGLGLNVSEAWLMGYDVPMEREAPAPELSKKDKILQWILNEATMSELAEIFEVISKRFKGET